MATPLEMAEQAATRASRRLERAEDAARKNPGSVAIAQEARAAHAALVAANAEVFKLRR